MLKTKGRKGGVKCAGTDRCRERVGEGMNKPDKEDWRGQEKQRTGTVVIQTSNPSVLENQS